MSAKTVLLAAAILLRASIIEAAEGVWDFVPGEDSFSDKALLDLRGMNEKQSGETGFVRLSEDGNSFVRGDGKPIRFWAIGSDIYRRTPEEMDRHCRFLAKMGVNMVRLHTTVANAKEGAKITDVNEKEIDGIFRFIKAAKENGIYLTISPYYGHHETPASWGLDGFDAKQRPWGAIFTDPKMQDAYKAWTRELYTRVNPHTGLPIKNDPTVAILQIHNEDSCFFWTFGSIPDAQKRKLGRKFAEWLAKEYGSLEKATARWEGAKAKLDDFEKGIVGLYGPWHMTQDWKGGTAIRVRDEVHFLAQNQRDFYAEMGRSVRDELGCKQLLNATNWRTANDERLKAIERWTYAALDIDAENEYYGSDYQHIGENDGYRIDPGHFLVNESCLQKPLELTANFKQQVGHPFIVTETSWKNPNLYQTEGPPLIAAYQSLGGVDVVFWFSAQETTWCLDPRRDFWRVGDSFAYHKWSCSVPTIIGMFPAAALIYRQGCLQEAPPVVHEGRPLEDLWDRKPALIDDNEIYGVSRETAECKSPRREDGRVSRAAFLVGRVESVLGRGPRAAAVMDFGKFLDAKNSRIHSATGELVWDYNVGLCTMNAPKAQGAVGFLKDAGGKFELRDVTIQSDNDYAAVCVVAMDNRPLKESQRILVQVGTTARLKGWKVEIAEIQFGKENPVPIKGKRIVNTGEPPWQVKNTQVSITLKNPNIRKATLLNPSGYAIRDIELKIDGNGTARLRLPTDAMYVVLGG